jgi:hypothetical protein
LGVIGEDIEYSSDIALSDPIYTIPLSMSPITIVIYLLYSLSFDFKNIEKMGDLKGPS